MRDPYTVLGLQKSADSAEIKSTFRKLAKKYHPDQSKEAKAKEKFAEISSAYEILGDDKKRAAFDRGEIDAEGKPRAPSFEGFDMGSGNGFGRRPQAGGSHFDFNFGNARGPGFGGAGFDTADILNDLFGGAGNRRGQRSAQPQRGEDVTINVTISLAEAVKGTKTFVTVPSGKTLEVAIPAGIEDGKQIRLKGQGASAAMGAGEAGDAMVQIKVAKHPYFQVDGRDLRLDLPLALHEAVLGAKVNVPTLDGAVELAVPAGSNGGKTLRLRGKGLPNQQGNPGDLYVTLRITLPDTPDSDLQDLMRKWDKEKRYNPRSDMT